MRHNAACNWRVHIGCAHLQTKIQVVQDTASWLHKARRTSPRNSQHKNSMFACAWAIEPQSGYGPLPKHLWHLQGSSGCEASTTRSRKSTCTRPPLALPGRLLPHVYSNPAVASVSCLTSGSPPLMSTRAVITRAPKRILWHPNTAKTILFVLWPQCRRPRTWPREQMCQGPSHQHSEALQRAVAAANRNSSGRMLDYDSTRSHRPVQLNLQARHHQHFESLSTSSLSRETKTWGQKSDNRRLRARDTLRAETSIRRMDSPPQSRLNPP